MSPTHAPLDFADSALPDSEELGDVFFPDSELDQAANHNDVHFGQFASSVGGVVALPPAALQAFLNPGNFQS